VPDVPTLFTKPRTALIGPHPAVINIPRCAQDGTSDYESELCVVIGKTGRDIPEENALEYVLGYTASNDVSARKLQMLGPQWCFSKGLDSSCPIGESNFLWLFLEWWTGSNCLVGPVLVSPSVIPDPQTLSIQCIHNGSVVQNSHTRSDYGPYKPNI
jgi:2-keto-4-pentenoate hydratase/2-oxohepta-3-ene-1,7-dioic acid hydratase in catechol pathway